MPDVTELLEVTKSVASKAGHLLLENIDPKLKNYTHCSDLPREVKSVADTVLEQTILTVLTPLGLPILSEESGYIRPQQESKYLFIIDPLDGTYNFIKGLGPSAVSIALWQEEVPVFGVIYDLVQHQLVWGGSDIGAYCDGDRISVSDTANKMEASICTGFPVRFDIGNDTAAQEFCKVVKQFAKVRMFGSAAASLVSVAKGTADYYSEQNIMLWDVAAGLAIVEGAGGAIQHTPGTSEHALHASAGNRILLESM